MKIAIVTYALQVGGIEAFIRLLADYFHEQGHEVTIIETHSEGRGSMSFSNCGYRVKQIFPEFYHSRLRHANDIARGISSFDAVILNDAPFAQAGLGLIPHNTVVIPVLHSNMMTMFRNAIANAANWDVLTTVSPRLYRHAITFGADASRVVCIPSGIRVPELWPKQNNPLSSSEPLRVVYVGTINHKHKGVFFLPGIIDRVMAEDSHVTFDIVGDGPDAAELCSRLGGHDKAVINFHGLLPNSGVMNILRKADVLIMPSQTEGLPIILLEAISCGTVPVATRLPGCTDFIIKHDENGFLVTLGDEAEFASSIIQLAQGRPRLRSMSRSAWQTAHNNFSYRSTGASYLELVTTIRGHIAQQMHGRRTGTLDTTLLGDLPYLPLFLVRPVRKALRIFKLMSPPRQEPELYEPPGASQ